MDPATTPKKKNSSEFSSQVTMSPTSLNEMESKMRDEIRKLQERRVGVLMDEVMQLQNERETLLSKLSNLETENHKLKEENATLKAAGNPSVQIEVLEKALQQEKDEKDKLKQRLRIIKRRNSNLNIDMNLDRGKSISLNEMSTTQDSTNATSIKELDQMRMKTFTVNTPSPRTKRYVLAATTTKNASTQTPTSSESDDTFVIKDATTENDNKNTMFSEDLKAALSEAKDTILEVLQEKETIEMQLAKELANSSTLREDLQGQAEALEKECTLLKSSLKQFHQWMNSKLRSVQEEMDICKVIYSLHGSLSQEATIIEQLTEKVQEQQRYLTQLQTDKSNLETKLVLTQKDLKSLRLKQRSSAHKDNDMCHPFYSNQLQQPEVIVNVESPVV